MQSRNTILDKVATLLPDMASRFKKLVDGLAIVTQQQVDKARGISKGLAGEHISLHPSADGTERFLTAELPGDYSGLVGLVSRQKLLLVAVTRIERVTRGL